MYIVQAKAAGSGVEQPKKGRARLDEGHTIRSCHQRIQDKGKDEAEILFESLTFDGDKNYENDEELEQLVLQTINEEEEGMDFD